MRVLISGWFSGRPIGSGQYTDRLAAALRDGAGAEDRFDVFAARGRAGAPGKVAFEQWTFPRAARGADVAHVPYWAPPLRPTVPTVVTVHDLIPLLVPAYRRQSAVRAYTALVARASAHAAALIADSEHTAADIRRELDVDPGRVHVVPLGVAARFRPPQDNGGAADRALRAALGLPERYGLYLGGFDPRKNLDTLLAAWRTVYATTGVPLVIVGRVPGAGDRLGTHPEEVARRRGVPPEALRLAGPVADADLPALYRGAAVFAYPSRYEGFGLPPLEALACGTPVVAADATSLPEVVGDAGLLVPPDDVDGWAAALGRVLEDDTVAADLRAAGPARAAAFTWAETARRTRVVYDLVAGAGRGSVPDRGAA